MIKHFIITRFMCENFDRPNDFIFDDHFLQESFLIMKNHLLKSLSIQSNKNFEFIIMIHNEIDIEKVRFLYELKDCYDFKIVILRKNELHDYINQFKEDYDYIITSRIDYDDHIYKTVVDDTQKRIDENYEVILYGLKNGVTVIDGEEEARFISLNYKGKGFFSVFETVIINTKKNKKVFSVYDLGDHTRIYKTLKEKYLTYGLSNIGAIKYLCDDTDETRYIWLRHKKSQSFMLNNTLHLRHIEVKGLNLSDFGYDKNLFKQSTTKNLKI